MNELPPPAARPTAAQQPLRERRVLTDTSRGSRPSSASRAADTARPSSSSSAIATAIQAENARVRRLSEASFGELPPNSGEALLGAGSCSRPSSRPSSRGASHVRLPLSAEVAAEFAPPSALGSSRPSSASAAVSSTPVSTVAPRRVSGAYGSAMATPPLPLPKGGAASTVGRVAAGAQAPMPPTAVARREPPTPSPTPAPAIEPAEDGQQMDVEELDVCKLWLDGVPLRIDLDSEELEDGVAPKSRGLASQRIISEHERELMQSLKALEEFRSNQSRRIFNEVAESSGVPFSSRGCAQQTATFGNFGEPHAQHMTDGMNVASHIAPQDAALDELFEGASIPVRSFDDYEPPDSWMNGEERPESVLGSSLIATSGIPVASIVIPAMPSGQKLVFNCVSTWGLERFVGLAGIEIFDGHGMPVILEDPKLQVTADPASINVLPEYENDPRTADKLFDQVNLTRDDLHTWLAPFFPERAHTVTVDLRKITSLSMIRIWNYNKSRLHSSRGVRDMEILLDDVPIFVGEIRRAPGALGAPEEACEHILLTQDDMVLQSIEKNDWLSEHFAEELEDAEDANGESEPNNLGFTAKAFVYTPQS